MTELPLDGDGFLRMDQFSDAEIDDPDIVDASRFEQPEPLPDAAWARLLSAAISTVDGTGTDDPTEVAEAVDPPAGALGDDGPPDEGVAHEPDGPGYAEFDVSHADLPPPHPPDDGSGW